MNTKTLIASIMLATALIGCGGSSTGKAINREGIQPYVPPKEDLHLPQDYLDSLKVVTQDEKNMLARINWYRSQSGLGSVTMDSKLHSGAKAHAKYLVRNRESGHNETRGKPLFYGEKPWNRMSNAGYDYGYSEDIAYRGDGNAAIDNLITAIYHRFPILNIDVTEVGCGVHGANNVVDFGVKPKSITRREYTLYPPKNGIAPIGSFEGERPNPLKDIGLVASGVPVSIDFDRESGCNIDMEGFTLQDISANKKVTMLKVMTAENDPNGFFTSCQFAFFPKYTLLQEHRYRADFEYNDGEKVTWNFAVREFKPNIDGAVDYNITANEQIFNIEEGKKYLFHVIPPSGDMRSDALSGYSINKQYDLDVTVEGERYFLVDDIRDTGNGDEAVLTFTNIDLRVGLRLIAP